jgi:hypothetical protein
MKVIAHVDQHAIRANIRKELAEVRPVLTVKTYKSNDRAYEAEFSGPVKLVYRPHQPLSCGARVWIETHGKVVLRDEGGNVFNILNEEKETIS